MKLFRYSADILPTSIFVALAGLDLYVYSQVDSLPFLTCWMLLMLTPKACICAWNHHHQHVHTFYSDTFNRLLELVYALHTGITTNAWVLHHNLGHHLHYLDQTKDESTWARKDGSTMGTAEYTIKLAITGYWRAYQVGKKHPKFQKGFLSCGALTFALVAALTVYRPVPALLVFLLPMLFGYIATCWHTYYHHAGLHSDNHLEASYNITHRWYNLLTGNLGYHTAHHSKQGLHWSLLPEFHATIAKGIPSELYRKPCIPFKWLPG
jgi:hypothetical protein